VAVVASDLSPGTRRELVNRADEAVIEFVHPTTNVAETISVSLERLGSELTLRDSTHVLVLPAECPQIRRGDIRAIVDHHVGVGAAVTVGAPTDDGELTEPVVTRDELGDITSIADVPLGGGSIMCVRASLLVPALRRAAVTDDFQSLIANVARVLDEAGHKVASIDQRQPLDMVRSATSRAVVEAVLRRRIIDDWIDRGVIMPDPAQVTIDASVHVGQGVRILPGSVLEGRTVVADGATIGPNSHLIDASVGSMASIPHSVVDGMEVDAHAVMTPFSLLSRRGDSRSGPRR